MRRARRAACAWAIALAATVAASPLRAQDAHEPRRVERLYLDDFSAAPAGLRAIDLYFRALSPRGAAVKDLAPADLELWEDGQRVEPEELSLESLERTGLGVTAVLALDVSGTMIGDPFRRAKEAALAFLDRLQPADRVGLVAFAEDVTQVAGFDLNRAETRERLSALEIDRQRMQRTLLFDGAFEAVDAIRSGEALPRRAFVILLSDGVDDGSRQSAERVISQARGADGRSPVLIFSIGYARFGRQGFDGLRALAESSGGQFLEADSAPAIGAFFDSVATQMRSSYLLRYPAELDGEPHEVRLSVQDRSETLRPVYPLVGRPILPWAGGAAALLLIVSGGGWALLRQRLIGRVAVVSGAKSGSVYEIKRGRTRIGALPDNDIVLLSGRVSRYHAEIVARGRRVEIADLRSTNGTRVNGQVVQQSPLRAGDRIAIADVELVYER